jgi:hypothetical protein
VTETHPQDDVLLALALDDMDDTPRESTLQHLGTCRRCRTEYDAMSATIEQTLAAAPSVEPSPGFDARVLGAMGLHATPPTVHAPSRPSRPRWQLVAASVAAGLVIGIGGGYAVSQIDGPEQATITEATAFLEKDDGERVGMVTRTVMGGDPVLLVTVTSGPVGMNYLCLLRLDNGEQIPTANWVLDSERGETWVVDAPTGHQVSEVVLVANGGAGPVWSTARL